MRSDIGGISTLLEPTIVPFRGCGQKGWREELGSVVILRGGWKDGRVGEAMQEKGIRDKCSILRE